jgi:hypothetical protein
LVNNEVVLNEAFLTKLNVVIKKKPNSSSGPKVVKTKNAPVKTTRAHKSGAAAILAAQAAAVSVHSLDADARSSSNKIDSKSSRDMDFNP